MSENKQPTKIKSFKKTKGYPKVVPISSNMAEGFSRQNSKEKLQYCFTAKGSPIELQSQLLIAKDIGHLSSKVFNRLAAQTVKVHKLLSGLNDFANRLTMASENSMGTTNYDTSVLVPSVYWLTNTYARF